MELDPWKPHGLALLDFFHGEKSAAVVVHGDDGEQETVPVRVFFREPPEFSALEDVALDLCGGSVLDVGAGAGCHSLVLEDRGIRVSAIDVVPEAVEVMRLRGLRDARCADIFDFPPERFHTLLLMMNGIGIVGTLAGLDRFLHFAQRLVKPGGQILVDSYDLRDSDAPGRMASENGDARGGYVGEMRFQLEYQGHRGSPYHWLFVDPATLARRATQAGWTCDVIWQEEEDHYLARLSPYART